jgi:hypothetical protein
MKEIWDHLKSELVSFLKESSSAIVVMIVLVVVLTIIHFLKVVAPWLGL